MGIPEGIKTELEASRQRTGATPQLLRASNVLRTLFTLPVELVEELFVAAGQVDAMSAASLSGMRETPDEYEITKDTAE
jgi:hypothetical protein